MHRTSTPLLNIVSCIHTWAVLSSFPFRCSFILCRADQCFNNFNIWFMPFCRANVFLLFPLISRALFGLVISYTLWLTAFSFLALGEFSVGYTTWSFRPLIRVEGVHPLWVLSVCWGIQFYILPLRRHGVDSLATLFILISRAISTKQLFCTITTNAHSLV